MKTKQQVAGFEKVLHSIDADIKTKEVVSKTKDLIDSSETQLRVAVQYDAIKDSSDAEVHDGSDDVFYFLEGSPQLTLGGKLKDAREISTGE